MSGKHQRAQHRSLLRSEIWRRSRKFLGFTAVVTVILWSLLAAGIPLWFGDKKGGILHGDPGFNFSFAAIAGLIAVAVCRGEHSGLRRLLSRLPIRPGDVIWARLQVALMVGIPWCTALFAFEFVAQPALMNPSFPDRLNTLERLSFEHGGIPVVQLETENEIHQTYIYGPVLQMMSRNFTSFGYGFWSVPEQEDHKWSEGEIVAQWTQKDWQTAKKYTRESLERINFPKNASAVVRFVRYEDREAYLGKTMQRRDGLGRALPWPFFARLIWFLGILIATTSIGSTAANRSLAFSSATWPVLLVFIWVAGILENMLPPWLQRTDLDLVRLHWPHADERLSFWEPWLLESLFFVFCLYHLRRGLRRIGLAYAGVKPEIRIFPMKEPSNQVVVGFVSLLCLTVVGITAVLISEQLTNYSGRFSPGLLIYVILGFGVFFAQALSQRWSALERLLFRLPAAPTKVLKERCLLIVGLSSVVGLAGMVLEFVPGLYIEIDRSGSGGSRFSRSDARFLEQYGAVPLLQLVNESGELVRSPVPEDSQKRNWEPPGQPFLPRGSSIQVRLEGKLEPETNGLRIGAEFEYHRDTRLRIVRLLKSKQEVREFLRTCAPAQWGDVPGPRWLTLFVWFFASCSLAFCGGLLVSSKTAISIVSSLTGWGSFAALFGVWLITAGEDWLTPSLQWLHVLPLVLLPAVSYWLLRGRLYKGRPLLTF